MTCWTGCDFGAWPGFGVPGHYLRYRAGPLWLTLSTAIFVVSLGILYAELFHSDIHEYLPYLALSQVLWSFLATLVGEGCTCFTQSEGVIRAVRMPLFLHALRTLMRNVLVLLHNVAVIVVVDIVFAIWPGGYALLALPGFVVWAVDALAIALLLGAFCARFRDIGPIVGSVMQIAFPYAGDLAGGPARPSRRAAAR